jgi:uncharacterized membrane protein YcaP (DUF421 family)
MSGILLTLLRGILAYFLLLAVARFVGRKVISQMTFFDYTVAISFGSLAARLAVENDEKSLYSGVTLVLFGMLAFFTSFILLKSNRLRKIADSEPVVVIARGELVKANMKKIRLNMNLLNALLREKDVFNISDVEYAIMECDGKLSVLLKSSKQPATPSDMNIAVPYGGLTVELIIDGSLMNENLRASGKDAAWLAQELGKKGITDYRDVFFAALDPSGNLYVSLGNTGREEHGKYGIE